MQGKGSNDTRISEIDDYLNNTVHGIDILRENSNIIIGICNLLLENKDKFIFTVGNGGSSATASHMVNDLMIGCGFKVICLSDNTPTLTAIANDKSYNSVFSEKLGVLGSEGGILCVFSGGGSSGNIIEVIKCALVMRLKVVAIIGTNGGEIAKKYANKLDYVLHIPIDMENYEDIQIIFCHLLKYLLSGDK